MVEELIQKLIEDTKSGRFEWRYDKGTFHFDIEEELNPRLRSSYMSTQAEQYKISRNGVVIIIRKHTDYDVYEFVMYRECDNHHDKEIIIHVQGYNNDLVELFETIENAQTPSQVKKFADMFFED